jgi:CRISPR/Cas system CSM-associated protein Csm2 small subunit
MQNKINTEAPMVQSYPRFMAEAGPDFFDVVPDALMSITGDSPEDVDNRIQEHINNINKPQDNKMKKEPCKEKDIVDITKLVHFWHKVDMRRSKPSENKYTFNTSSIKNINFHKIQDDLSYQRPLAIVRTGEDLNNQVYAVVHHSIRDKYARARFTDQEDTLLHHAVFNEFTLIDNTQVKGIVESINVIKQAKWIESRAIRTQHMHDGTTYRFQYLMCKQTNKQQ